MKKNNKFYVTMTDRSLSKWGLSKGKINKLVLECNDYEELDKVYNNALKRNDMKYVNIRYTKPCYNKNYYFVSFHNREDYPNFYKQGFNFNS
jgi:hypothetical protein